MKNVRKKDLVMAISKEKQLPPALVQSVIQSFFDTVMDSLQEGARLELRDFGVFSIAMRQSRLGRNPRSPHTVVSIPAKRVVRFIPGKKMKAIVEQGKDHG